MINYTWSKSCFPVVLGWMANSSSASTVVTRTFTCEGSQRSLLLNENSPSNGILGTTKFHAGFWLAWTTYHFRHLESSFLFPQNPQMQNNGKSCRQCKVLQVSYVCRKLFKTPVHCNFSQAEVPEITETVSNYKEQSHPYPNKRLSNGTNNSRRVLHRSAINLSYLCEQEKQKYRTNSLEFAQESSH